MQYADYHLHTGFSPDSREKIENICEKALEEGISEIVLTDHCEFPLMEETPWPDFAKRREVIEQCREKYGPGSLRAKQQGGHGVVIKEGTELGQPYYDLPLMRELMAKESFDYVIGSVHHAAARQDYKNISINEDNFADYFEMYLQNTRTLVETGDFDCVGHIDYFFKHCPPELVQRHPPETFEKEYKEIFDLIVSGGKGIEINCSGLRMPSVQNTLPSVELLRWYRSCGGKTVTIGSDGHSCRSAFSGIAQGYENLRAAGFTRVARFNNREVYYIDI